jgi:hypothetical protein
MSLRPCVVGSAAPAPGPAPRSRFPPAPGPASRSPCPGPERPATGPCPAPIARNRPTCPDPTGLNQNRQQFAWQNLRRYPPAAGLPAPRRPSSSPRPAQRARSARPAPPIPLGVPRARSAERSVGPERIWTEIRRQAEINRSSDDRFCSAERGFSVKIGRGREHKATYRATAARWSRSRLPRVRWRRCFWAGIGQPTGGCEGPFARRLLAGGGYLAQCEADRLAVRRPLLVRPAWLI